MLLLKSHQKIIQQQQQRSNHEVIKKKRKKKFSEVKLGVVTIKIGGSEGGKGRKRDPSNNLPKLFYFFNILFIIIIIIPSYCFFLSIYINFVQFLRDLKYSSNLLNFFL